MGTNKNNKQYRTAFVLGSFGQNNIGDEAILQAFLEFCKEKKIIPVVSSRNPRQTERIYKIHSVNTSPIRDIRKKISILIHANYYILAGGTIIIEHPYTKNGKTKYFRRPLYFILFLVLCSKILRKKMILSHIGISPLSSSLSRHLAKIIIHSVDLITVRDLQSYKIAKKISPNSKCFLASDSAFSLKITPKNFKVKKQKDQLIIIPNYYSFPSIIEEREKTVDRFVSLIKQLKNQSIFASFLLMPFRSNFGPKDDLWVSRQIVKKLPNYPISIQVTSIDENMVGNVIHAFMQARMIITQRQHGLIFAHLADRKVLAANMDPKIYAFMRENSDKRHVMPLDMVDASTIKAILSKKKTYSDNNDEALILKAKYGFELLEKAINSAI